MAQTCTDEPVRYAAWLMLTRSLASRLDFDMRILPAATLTPTITLYTATLLQTASVILGLPDLTNIMLAQVQLPGHLGGLFLTNPFNQTAGSTLGIRCLLLVPHIQLDTEKRSLAGRGT